MVAQDFTNHKFIEKILYHEYEYESEYGFHCDVILCIHYITVAAERSKLENTFMLGQLHCIILLCNSDQTLESVHQFDPVYFFRSETAVLTYSP